MWMDSASFTMDSYSKSSRMNTLVGLGLGLVPESSMIMHTNSYLCIRGRTYLRTMHSS